MESRYLKLLQAMFLDVDNSEILEVAINPRRKVNRAFDTLCVTKEQHKDGLPKEIILVGPYAYVVKLWRVNNESYMYHIKYTLDLSKIFSPKDVLDIINEL